MSKLNFFHQLNTPLVCFCTKIRPTWLIGSAVFFEKLHQGSKIHGGKLRSPFFRRNSTLGWQNSWENVLTIWPPRVELRHPWGLAVTRNRYNYFFLKRGKRWFCAIVFAMQVWKTTNTRLVTLAACAAAAGKMMHRRTDHRKNVTEDADANLLWEKILMTDDNLVKKK